MFLETLPALGIAGESCPTVDSMSFAWSGSWPANRAPAVTTLTLGGLKADASVTLIAGQSTTAQVAATEPDGDPLTFLWEILEDSDVSGGSASRPLRVGQSQKTTAPTLAVTAPVNPGLYRLYVYALDGKGHVGTANLPFRVN
jgi:hypothetical protein